MLEMKPLASFALAILAGCGSSSEEPTTDDAGPETTIDAGDAANDSNDAATDATPDSRPPPTDSETRYPNGALHSPLSPSVVARLAKVLASSPGRHDVFAKVGNSITVDSNFLHCFDGTDVKLDVYSSLEPTHAFFGKTLADGTRTSYGRNSLAAVIGWGASKPIAGSPSPIEQEVAAIKPAFAVVELGTNDTYDTGVIPFERNLRLNVESLLSLGVIPTLTTIPPRGDTVAANTLVPEMNAVIRAVAQAKQVPMMDFWQTCVPLPQYGLSPDGIHPQVYYSGGAHGCWFTDPALQKAMNHRNLITLQSFDRLRRMLIAGEAAEPAPPDLAGKGTWDAPYAIDALPFVDDRDTLKVETRTADKYSCSSADEGGPEIVYTLTLTAPTHLRARVYCDDGVDVDLHWLTGTTADTCSMRADKTIDLTAGPGTFRLVADTFVSGGKELRGAYRMTIVALP